MNQRKGSTEAGGMVDVETEGSWAAAVRTLAGSTGFSPGTHFQAGWCGRPPLVQEKSNWDWWLWSQSRSRRASFDQ